LRESAAAAGITVLPEATVLAGHSAGGNLALAAAGYLTGRPGFERIRAVVMLDGGAGDDASHAGVALELVPDSLSVLQIASPRGSACIPQPVVTDALVAARPGRFVGVTIVGGNHLDATGYDPFNLTGYLVCGWPRQENVAAVRQIAGDWIRNALTGSSGGVTGGTSGQVLKVGAASVRVL
jgi:pimeloyl-ACP methyl ester carboxylesterase